MKDESNNSINNTAKPDSVNIGITLVNFEFEFHIPRNKKLKNIRKMDCLKENIAKYLKDFTLQKYSLHFIPDLNKNEEELVSEWYKHAEENKIRPVIIIRSRKEPTSIVGTAWFSISFEASQDNLVKNLCFELKNSTENALQKLISRLEQKFDQQNTNIEEKHQKEIQNIREEFEKQKIENEIIHQKNIQDISNRLKNDLKASKNIQKLVNFISLFRIRIITHFNNNGKNYLDWKQMKENESEDSINNAVLSLGFNLDSWFDLVDLMNNLNGMKNTQVTIEDALKYIDSLQNTDYEKYQVPFKNLINLF
jgi:hypothetical protein